MVDLTRTYRQDFFCRDTLAVARDLLGALLCRRVSGNQILFGPIVEVEAYTQDDPACHAARGQTKRCRVMFGPPGHAYVYFIYGMYHCLNVVTEPEGTAGAVLIRAVGAEGTNGPGKLCREWQIDWSHNGASLLRADSELWISPGNAVPDSQILRSPRVGITSATDRHWRFYLKGHPCVSKPTTSRARKTRSRS